MVGGLQDAFSTNFLMALGNLLHDPNFFLTITEISEHHLHESLLTILQSVAHQLATYPYCPEVSKWPHAYLQCISAYAYHKELDPSVAESFFQTIHMIQQMPKYRPGFAQEALEMLDRWLFWPTSVMRKGEASFLGAARSLIALMLYNMQKYSNTNVQDEGGEGLQPLLSV